VLKALPDGCLVLLRTHGDKSGAKYATEILDVLRERWLKHRVALDVPTYFEITDAGVVLK